MVDRPGMCELAAPMAASTWTRASRLRSARIASAASFGRVALRVWLPVALSVLASAGCLAPPHGSRVSEVDPIRVSDMLGRGDPAREASLRLVIQGLEADAAGNSRLAQGRYESAVRVDATNPFVYLALAQHAANGVDLEDALSFVDQAVTLFEAEGLLEPSVEVHVIGLRGEVKRALGRISEARPLLERARLMAPDVWADGRLDPLELR